jgi:hypothetical protein
MAKTCHGSSFSISVNAANEQIPAVASIGADYLVAWEDSRNAGSGKDIYAARVTDGGVLQDTNGIVVCTANFTQTFPAVAANGTNYLIAWADFRSNSAYDIYAARVSPGGVLLDTNAIVVSTNSATQYAPSAAGNGNDYLVVWHDNHSGAYDIYGARVTGAGTVRDPNGFAICTAANTQQYPAVAGMGSDWLVAWADFRNSTTYPDIYGGRVTSLGTVSDADGFVISTAANTQQYPAMAANGVNYLVVYTSDASATNRVRGNLITP